MLDSILSSYCVEEILSTNILIENPDTKTSDIIEKMLYFNIPEVIVVDHILDKEILLGIITLSDISKIKQQNKNLSKPVSFYAVKELITVTPNVLVSEARKLLIDKNIGRLIVYENNKVVGIIRSENIRDNYYMKLVSINEQYKHIINNMYEGVAVTNAKGYVTFWNSNAEKMYDIKSEDILNKKMLDFFPNALTLSVLENKIAIENVYHSPKPNYHAIISALPIYIENEFMGVVSTERDITDYKNLTVSLENANSQIDLLKAEVEKITTGGFSLGHIIGKSSIIQKKIQIAKHVSQTDTSVLITGESGTGKEVFARAIHQNSGRKGLFVPVNCSAIPQTLFESEFFGYVGGAFTGALKKGKLGFFELANNGTLFLDEVGDLPLDMQAKLLRVLQERKVVKIGAEKDVDIDARIISATNKNLKHLISIGSFREDLYYRLNVVEIELPSLRERKEDIILLFDNFLHEICKKNNIKIEFVDKSIFDVLINYDWKGNIRELRNTVESMIVLSYNSRITKDSIPQYITKNTQNKKLSNDELVKFEDIIKLSEIELIKNAMNEAGGNKLKAAKRLNIPRSTLYYKLKLYNM